MHKYKSWVASIALIALTSATRNMEVWLTALTAPRPAPRRTKSATSVILPSIHASTVWEELCSSGVGGGAVPVVTPTASQMVATEFFTNISLSVRLCLRTPFSTIDRWWPDRHHALQTSVPSTHTPEQRRGCGTQCIHLVWASTAGSLPLVAAFQPLSLDLIRLTSDVTCEPVN